MKVSRIFILFYVPRKNTCQMFLPKQIPGIKNFKPPKTLRSYASPSLEIRSTLLPTWSLLCECGIKIDHYAGNYDHYSLRLVCGFLLCPTELLHVPGLWDRTYGFSCYSVKTRKSNRLQMLLQREHLFLTYFKDPECWFSRGLNHSPPAPVHTT